jgi:hypothetical protein
MWSDWKHTIRKYIFIYLKTIPLALFGMVVSTPFFPTGTESYLNPDNGVSMKRGMR